MPEDDEGGDDKLVTSLQMKESKDKKEDGRKKSNGREEEIMK